MALALGMNIEGDNKIYLNELLVTVDSIKSQKEVTLTVHGDFLEEQKVITDSSYTQITGDVKMMLGSPKRAEGWCTVLVEAPRNIKVLRGCLKKKG